MSGGTIVEKNRLRLVESQLWFQVLAYLIKELLILLHLGRSSKTEYWLRHAVADGSVHSG